MVLMKAWSDHVSLVNFFIFLAQGRELLVADMTRVQRVRENPSFPNLVVC